MTTRQIEIDPEFHALIPPLTGEEREQLEENLARDGCRDPLVVWAQPPKKCPECGHDALRLCNFFDVEHVVDGTGYERKDYIPVREWICGALTDPVGCKEFPSTPLRDFLRYEADDEGCGSQIPMTEAGLVLLDGHNRFEICERRKIDYRWTELVFDSREDAADWIDANQLGRRNLKPDQMSLLRGRRYNRAKRQGARTDLTSDQNGQKCDTARRLAKEHGVSRPTIVRDGQFADAVEKAKELDPDLGKKVATGEAPPRAAVIKAAKLLDKDPEKAREVLSGAKTVTQVEREAKEEQREQRREENRRTVEMFEKTADKLVPAHQFATIVLDPPWDWGDEGDVDQLGRARPTYDTMPLAEVEKLPVADFADEDCHLYLWITNRSLPKGFALLEAWGFRYITCLTWCKPSIGMGNYFRGSTEQVLFGVKGSQPLKRKDVGTWFAAPRGEKGHSSKPGEFFKLVESCSPGPYLEMLARETREGWAVWGAEV